MRTRKSASAMFSKLGLAIIAVFLFQSSFAQGLKGDSWASVKESKTGEIVFTYIETPALAYKGTNGKLTGVSVDIMESFIKYLEKSKGVKVTYRVENEAESFHDFFQDVKKGSGGVFGLANVGITDSRKREVSFSPGYINSLPMLVTHNSVATLQDLKTIGTNFKFMKAYVTKGTLNEKRILDIKNQSFKDLTLFYATSGSDILERVTSDDNSFAYIDLVFYLEAVKKRMEIKRHPAGDKPAEEFGIIMPQNSDWEDVIREFFDANGGYKNSSEYKKIIIKHLGTTGAKLLESAKVNNI
jgi:ABC-type amino acid transport substrate-binding protein